MRSECIAAWPHSIYSYTWKAAASQRDQSPASLNHARGHISLTGEQVLRETAKAEHPSMSWKAYLASREFQNLASDLADAVFSAAPRTESLDFARPSILTENARPQPSQSGKPYSRLVAAVLPAEDDVEAHGSSHGPDLAIAA